MPNANRQIVVFTDARPALAYLVRDRLREAGIECFLENEALRQGAGELPWQAISPRIVVAESNAQAAREIVAQFRSEARGGERSAENAALMADDATAERGTKLSAAAAATIEIASCPGCGHPRMTACPYCHTASAVFPLADQAPDPARQDPTVLLLCPTCDEPFAPDYLRRCEWCGHDFGFGVELEPKAVVRSLNDRVIVAALGVALVMLAVLAYFSTLLR